MDLSDVDAATGLARDLIDARTRSLALIEDLTDDQLLGPRLSIVNPLVWEIGHLAWFQERWLLRRTGEPSIRRDADALYDSFQVPHDTRWDLPLPSRVATLAYARAVLDRVLDRLGERDPGPEAVYFHRMVTFHEDMHAEAFTYTRQTLGYAPPRPAPLRPEEERASRPTEPRPGGRPAPGARSESISGDVEIPGGLFLLGATRDLPFVFDNEKWAHPVEVGPFRIARAVVTQAEFARFTSEGGYEREDFWSPPGWRWRRKEDATRPIYWRQERGGAWMRKHFDAWVPLEPDLPAIHVNQFEAEAYCRWAGRRLPTEGEWERAASSEPERDFLGVAERKRRWPWGDDPPSPELAHLDSGQIGCVEIGAHPAGDSAFGCRQMIGNVWEWTASVFAPYPGFAVDPYKEYSQPWFGGDYRVLRGGCWATRSRLIRNTWRNFYTANRRDVLAGFRTCAL